MAQRRKTPPPSQVPLDATRGAPMPPPPAKLHPDAGTTPPPTPDESRTDRLERVAGHFKHFPCPSCIEAAALLREWRAELLAAAAPQGDPDDVAAAIGEATDPDLRDRHGAPPPDVRQPVCGRCGNVIREDEPYVRGSPTLAPMHSDDCMPPCSACGRPTVGGALNEDGRCDECRENAPAVAPAIDPNDLPWE